MLQELQKTEDWLSHKKEPCKNLLCLRGVKGGGDQSEIRQRLFRAPGNSKVREPWAQGRPAWAQHGLGPATHPTSTPSASPAPMCWTATLLPSRLKLSIQDEQHTSRESKRLSSEDTQRMGDRIFSHVTGLFSFPT